MWSFACSLQWGTERGDWALRTGGGGTRGETRACPWRGGGSGRGKLRRAPFILSPREPIPGVGTLSGAESLLAKAGFDTCVVGRPVFISCHSGRSCNWSLSGFCVRHGSGWAGSAWLGLVACYTSTLSRPNTQPAVSPTRQQSRGNMKVTAVISKTKLYRYYKRLPCYTNPLQPKHLQTRI